MASRALAQCLDFASEASEAAMHRCLEETVNRLLGAQAQAEKQPDRDELGDAARQLQSLSRSWSQRFPVEVRKAFAESQHRKQTPQGTAASPRAELTLVDEAEILDTIAMSRLLQHLVPMLEQPVSALDALVSSALGHASVQPELNPLRPESFAQALRTVMGRGPHTTVWMKYLAEPLGIELLGIYADLLTRLEDANVQAVGYAISQPAELSPATRAAEPIGNPRKSRDGERRFPLHRDEFSGRQISQSLLRNFLAHGPGPESAQALPNSYYAEVDQEIQALHAAPESVPAALQAEPAAADTQDLPAVDRPVRRVGVQSSLDAQAWGPYARARVRSLVRSQLRKDATQVGQVLGLELVRKVVNEVAQDPRLLAPVREAIVALEPSLMRLAMVDPCFVSDETHPGRSLMESVAQRSFKYNDEFSSAFAGFFEEVRGAFTELNKAVIEGSAPFEEALARMNGSWEAEDQREIALQQPAIAAVQYAERRQAEAEQIAWDMSSRADLEDVPEVVQEFLFGPWALVMAHARLSSKSVQPDPQGYGSVISDLLWSVKREVTLKQPAQLFQRVPHLITTLRAGLASIGQEPAESEPFFNALMKLHNPVLKLRRVKSRRDAEQSGNAPLMAMSYADDEPVVRAENTEGQPWMSLNELDAAGFQETLPTGMGELTEEPSVPAPAESPPAAAEGLDHAMPEPPEAVLSRLREGDWVDLYSKRKWLRAQLIWAGTKATLFMFVSHGGHPHSMTRRICERLIRERFLRPVRTHAVVAHALDTIQREPA